MHHALFISSAVSISFTRRVCSQLTQYAECCRLVSQNNIQSGIRYLLWTIRKHTVGFAKAKTEQMTSSVAEKGKKAAAGARERKGEMLDDHLVP